MFCPIKVRTKNGNFIRKSCDQPCQNWNSSAEWKRVRAKPRPPTIIQTSGLAQLDKPRKGSNSFPSPASVWDPRLSFHSLSIWNPSSTCLNIHTQMIWWDNIPDLRKETKPVTFASPTRTGHQSAETGPLGCVFKSFLCPNTTKNIPLGKEILKSC